MNTLKSLDKPLIGMKKKLTGEENLYVFKSNELCDFAGKEENESHEDDEA